MDLEVLVNGDYRAACRPCHCALVLVDLSLRWRLTMMEFVLVVAGVSVEWSIDPAIPSGWKAAVPVPQAQYSMIRYKPNVKSQVNNWGCAVCTKGEKNKECEF